MRSTEDIFLFILVAAASLAFAWVILPFFGAILWALVAAIVFAPLRSWLTGPLRLRPGLAALLSVATVILVVVLPLMAVIATLAGEASILYSRLQSGDLDPGARIAQILDALPPWAKTLQARLGLTDLSALNDRVISGLRQASRELATQILSIGQSTFQFVANLGVMVYLLFFLFRDGDVLRGRLAAALPLKAEQQRALLGKFAAVVRATVKGGVLVAILQGALGGAFFWFLGLHAPLLWAALMAFLSLVPAVGASLVWLPVAIYLLATGSVWQGLALTAFGILVISLVDNILRPVLVGKDSRMPDYVVLVSTLGGLSIFGPNGFVIGPAAAAMFIAVWQIFSESRQQDRN